MNYIEQINSFWVANEELQLKSNEIAVYFALLKYNNSLGWINSFRCDYAIICQYAGISKNTFYKVIETLAKANLIEHEKGERNILKPKISILKIKNRKGTTLRIEKEQHEEQHEEQKGNNLGNLNKLLNNKTIKLLNKHFELVNENLENWIAKNFEESKDAPVKDNVFTFENFWQMYGKKKDRKVCEDKFKKLTVSDLEAIKIHLPSYVKSTPEIKYRKDPATYLNQKSYLDALESKVNLFNENVFEGLRFFYKNVPGEIFIDRDKCIAIPDSVYGYCTRVIKYPEYTKLRNFLEKNGVDINNLPTMNEDPQSNFTDVEPLERLKQWIGKN